MLTAPGNSKLPHMGQSQVHSFLLVHISRVNRLRPIQLFRIRSIYSNLSKVSIQICNHSSTLSRFFRTNQRDDPRQLRALFKLLPLNVLGCIARSNFSARLEHPVLQRQHFRKRVVEKGRGELDVAGRRRESDFEFSGRLAAVLRLRFLNRLSDHSISHNFCSMGAIRCHTLVSRRRICFLPSQRHDSRSSTPLSQTATRALGRGGLFAVPP